MTAKDPQPSRPHLPPHPELDSPAEERPEFASTLRLVDYFEELWRWKYVLGILCLVATGVMTVYAITRMNTYKSESRLMVTAPRQGLNANTALGLNTAHMQYSPTDGLIEVLQSEDLVRRTMLKMVRGRPLYERVIVPVAPSEEETAKVTNPLRRPLVRYTHSLWRSWAVAARADVESRDREELVARAISLFRSRLTLRTNQSSATVIAAFRSEDPVKSRDILKAFIEEGIAYYIHRNSASTLGKAMVGMIDRAREQYLEAHRKLEKFLRQLGVSDYRGHLTRLRTQIGEMEAEIRASQARLKGLVKERKRLTSDLQQMKNDEFIPSAATLQTTPNPAFEAVRAIVIELSGRLENERSPEERTRLAKRLDERKKELAALPPFLSEEVRGQIRNPAYIQTEAALIAVGSEIRSIESRLGPQEESLAEFKKEMDQLLAKEPEWDRLHSEMERRRNQKDDLNNRHQRVEISRNLDEQGISNLSLVDQDRVATLEPVKEGPSRAKYILAGFFGSLFGGAVLIMLALRISTRITRGAQLEKILGVEVTAQVPYLTRSNIKRYLRARTLGWN